MTLVLWSGGCDSTLALFDESRKSEKGKPTKAISVDHYNVGAGKQQARARTRILAALKKRGHYVEHVTVKISADEGTILKAQQSGIVQAALWLGTVTPYLATDEDLVTGYIRGDDAFHYRSQLVGAFRGLRNLQNKNGELRFPLEWSEKADVIRRLREVDLFDLVWWCEDPHMFNPCGDCAPCKSVFKAEVMIREEKRRLRASKKKARRKK